MRKYLDYLSFKEQDKANFSIINFAEELDYLQPLVILIPPKGVDKSKQKG
jgi:hypothetical protein